jgi:RNA polymerase subunit RPABC4/transcription elongation factor Spt4
MAAKKEIFYVYDTFHATDAQVKDYRQHREMFANMAKRSRYFFVAPAKAYKPEEIKGQIEVGLRYYEASAAGAIMLGQVPYCESFNTMFDWPDAVIEIKPDGSDVADVLESLAAQPERLLEISRRNAIEALLRHDWVYRWKKILDIAGLKPTTELGIRENRLKQMAEEIGNGK